MFQTFSNHQVVTNGKRNTDCNYLQTDILVGYTSQDAIHHQDCCILRLENTYKPSFVTLAGWGVYRYIQHIGSFQPSDNQHESHIFKRFNPAFLRTRICMTTWHTMTHWQCSTIQGSLQLRTPNKSNSWGDIRSALCAVWFLNLEGSQKKETSMTCLSQLAVNQNFCASLQS